MVAASYLIEASVVETIPTVAEAARASTDPVVAIVGISMSKLESTLLLSASS